MQHRGKPSASTRFGMHHKVWRNALGIGHSIRKRASDENPALECNDNPFYYEKPFLTLLSMFPHGQRFEPDILISIHGLDPGSFTHF